MEKPVKRGRATRTFSFTMEWIDGMDWAKKSRGVQWTKVVRAAVRAELERQGYRGPLPADDGEE